MITAGESLRETVAFGWYSSTVPRRRPPGLQSEATNKNQCSKKFFLLERAESIKAINAVQDVAAPFPENTDLGSLHGIEKFRHLFVISARFAAAVQMFQQQLNHMFRLGCTPTPV
ncbi:hypothetical protein C8R45DRAFT_935513 [Mycena sanguinolenta]|nr:hypothetical protein C8R45DRAFT_935513 [Mycena sanguinolenta]